MSEQAIYIRKASKEEAEIAGTRHQGNDGVKQERMRRQMSERIQLCLPIGHLRCRHANLHTQQIHEKNSSGIVG